MTKSTFIWKEKKNTRVVICNEKNIFIFFILQILRVPQGLEDVSKYPYLFAELLESDRWSEEDIAKLAGKNLIRVFKQVEQVSNAFNYFLSIKFTLSLAT